MRSKDMLPITPALALPSEEIRIEYIRAAGPGGQNVNKVATAAQLTFDVRATRALSPEVKERLLRLAGRRAGVDGVITIVARRYRSQERNRADALARLADLVRAALRKPPVRKATRPTRAANARRLQAKKRRGEAKRLRRSSQDE